MLLCKFWLYMYITSKYCVSLFLSCSRFADSNGSDQTLAGINGSDRYLCFSQYFNKTGPIVKK
jgi:hypothetical protein